MIERLGKDIVVNGDVLPAADYYDGIDDPAVVEADEARIDKIISGIDSKAPKGRPDARVLGQGALFSLDEEVRTQRVEGSVREHPSSQNVLAEILDTTVEEIIQKYNEEAAKLIAYKKNPDFSQLRKDAWHAARCNRLSLEQIDILAEGIGYGKNFSKRINTPTPTEEEREPDFRERQYKD